MRKYYKLSIRIDEDIKDKAAEIFEKLGIDVSTAVRIFINKCIETNGLPFDMTINKNNKNKN